MLQINSFENYNEWNMNKAGCDQKANISAVKYK